jgi:hypothetical protein
MEQPGAQAARFPRLYAMLKWTIVGALAVLALVAVAFWVMVLGGFAGSGFHARTQPMGAGEDIAVTTECAWPYSVQDAEAKAVCRIFYNLSPEERAQVLKARR